jgi:hypothetical protein
VYGTASYMVRCLAHPEGKPCEGMIDIPLGGKGQCPKCGAVRGLHEYRAEHGKIRVKSPVESRGVKA